MDKRCNDFVCTICYDIFLYPVCLPCNHRFCKSCLDKHLENNTMSCPICRFRVSNWLRQLRRSNADVVDKPFWDTVQKLYPEELEKRTNGRVDYESHLKYFRKRLATFDDKEKARCTSLHKAFLDPRYLQDQEEDWFGWSEPVFQVCHNILQYVKDHPDIETPTTLDDSPRRLLAKQGEIHEEYEQFLQKELEEKKREDEENFRLSEAMIKMIEEEEKREEEERRQQLLKDEELARRLLEEEGAADRDKTPDEGRSKVQRTPRRRTRGIRKLLQDDVDLSPVPESSGCCTSVRLRLPTNLDSPSTSKEVRHCQSPKCLDPSAPSTSRLSQCSQSPIRLDTQSTSKENVFAKFWNSSPSSSHTTEKKSTQETISIDSKAASISNKELSHFATVQASPSNVANGPKPKKKKKEEVPPTSRCSSGNDSISQELNHFKPIRTSPTTPPKDGSKGLVPKVVVAQRGVSVPDLNIVPLAPLLDANLSLDEIKTSINIEKQLEEDRRLAIELQNQLNEELVPTKADYNLRKRKRPSGSSKKKVLVDRSQTTLDNLLIK